MDLNYDINTWDFSLRTATLTKITQNVVEAALQNPRTPDFDTIVLRATEIAENLDLLPSIITDIKKLIPSILRVLQKWFNSNGYGIRPILTPHGTVDVAKSARAFIISNDQDLPIRVKFDMACDYCLEEDIFHFVKLLSEAEQLLYEKQPHNLRTMQGFWYGIYKDNFSTMLTLNDLSPANLVDGLNRAMGSKMILAIKHFLKKASREIVQHIVNNRSYFFFINSHPSPDTIVRLIQCMKCESMSYGMLLLTLLQWPYQHLFLNAAKALVSKISLEEFWVTAGNMILQWSCREDNKYKGLFVCFWKMRKDYVGVYVNCNCMSFMLYSVFLMRDKHIAFMVFDGISERNKEEYLPDFNRICIKLIFSKDYETLRFIMDVCKVKDKTLYLRLKNFDEENRSGIIQCPILPERIYAVNSTKEFKTSLHLFKRLMSEWESSEQLEK